MATTLATLNQRVRRYMGDWPDQENLSASLSSSATSITVTDGTKYFVNELLEIDSEDLLVRSIATNTLTVARAALGTAATTHASGASLLWNPNFTTIEITDALADGIDAAFPFIYRRIVDETITVTDATVYEYSVPTDASTSEVIPFVTGVSVKEPGDSTFRPLRRWYLVRSDTPKLHLKFQPTPGAIIRVSGACRFPRLAAGGSLDGQWPSNLEYPLVEYAAGRLLASGEARRVRVDRGVLDAREQANQVGASSAASQLHEQRYMSRVVNSGYPPLPRRQVAV